MFGRTKKPHSDPAIQAYEEELEEKLKKVEADNERLRLQIEESKKRATDLDREIARVLRLCGKINSDQQILLRRPVR